MQSSQFSPIMVEPYALVFHIYEFSFYAGSVKPLGHAKMSVL